MTRPTRLQLGLWIRMAVAGVIAGLGGIVLLPFEVVAVVAMVLILLVTIPYLIVVSVPPLTVWYVLAGCYRRVMPVPLVAGRITHGATADAVDRVARFVTHPDEFIPLRALGIAVAILAGWVLGYVLVAHGTPVTPLWAGVAIGLAAGVVTVVYHTGRTIYDELGAGGTIERQLAADLDPIEPTDDSRSDIRDATAEDLQVRVDRLANQASVPAPTVRLGRERLPIAATAGFRPETSTIVVSDGLLDALTDRELDAVLAHELAHIINRDAAMLTALSLPVAKVDSVLDLHDDDDDSLRQVLVHPLFVLVAIGIAALSRWAVIVVARYREYVADRGAVALTGDPAALASALETLDTELENRPSNDLRQNRSTAAFSIVPPPWEEHRFFDRVRRFVARNLYGTHPPTAKRIERLRARA